MVRDSVRTLASIKHYGFVMDGLCGKLICLSISTGRGNKTITYNIICQSTVHYKSTMFYSTGQGNKYAAFLAKVYSYNNFNSYSLT